MMKKALVVFALLCRLVCLSDCASAAKVVAYTLARALPEDGQTSISSLSRRANALEVLTNNIPLLGYYASVQVGTPVQNVSLILSTGSSDVWVLDGSAFPCAAGNCLTPCRYYGCANPFCLIA
jgi:hypothetical protein